MDENFDNNEELENSFDQDENLDNLVDDIINDEDDSEFDEDELVDEVYDPATAEDEAISTIFAAGKQDPGTSVIKPPKTKLKMISAMSDMMTKMGKGKLTKEYKRWMDEDQLSEDLEDEFEDDNDDWDDLEDLDIPDNSFVDDFEEVVGESALDEATQIKATKIFETAVKAAIVKELHKLQEENDIKYQHDISNFQDQLVETVDEFFDVLGDEWLEQNELALEQTIESNILKGFLNDVVESAKKYYIDLPESEVNVLGEVTEDFDKLRNSYDIQVEQNIKTNNRLKEYKKRIAVLEASEGLPETAKEKLFEYAESMEYESDFPEIITKLRNDIEDTISDDDEDHDLEEDYRPSELEMFLEDENDDEYGLNEDSTFNEDTHVPKFIKDATGTLQRMNAVR